MWLGGFAFRPSDILPKNHPSHFNEIDMLKPNLEPQ